ANGSLTTGIWPRLAQLSEMTLHSTGPGTMVAPYRSSKRSRIRCSRRRGRMGNDDPQPGGRPNHLMRSWVTGLERGFAVKVIENRHVDACAHRGPGLHGTKLSGFMSCGLLTSGRWATGSRLSSHHV